VPTQTHESTAVAAEFTYNKLLTLAVLLYVDGNETLTNFSFAI
jgi:hypothetical protein